MQIHEVVQSDEKPPSDKTKPDIVTQIAGPTLGSSTPNYNPDYAIQGKAFSMDCNEHSIFLLPNSHPLRNP